MQNRLGAISLLLPVIVACSGSAHDNPPPPSASSPSIDATIGGTSLRPISALAKHVVVTQTGSTQLRGLKMSFSDKANDCSTAHLADGKWLDVDIVGDPVVPGTFTIVDGQPHASQGYSDFVTTDASCKLPLTAAGHATSGTVTITSVGATISGSLDITFPDGHAKGSFEVVVCDTNPPPDCSP